MEALKINRYALYVFDYGAPTGFRLAMATLTGSHLSFHKMGMLMTKVLAMPGGQSGNTGPCPQQKTGRYSGTTF
jgi:hypothetical protein